MLKLAVRSIISCVGAACLTGCATTSTVAPSHFSGREVAAIAVAVNAFTAATNRKFDLRHYTVDIERHGDTLEVTFGADPDPPPHPPNWAGTGGGSVYGPDMRYVVSLTTLKVLRFNFFR